MKKFSVLLTLAVLMVSSSVFAGSIDYLSNQSAKYLMTLNRNASTDASADLAYYNPAGTAFLAPGFYIDLSNQTLLKAYKTTATTDMITLGVAGTETTYKQDEPTYLLPNLYAAYNFGQIGIGKLAAYGQVGVTGGGGTLKWDDGSPAVSGALTQVFTLANWSTPGTAQNALSIKKAATSKLEVYSVYYAFGAGAAYSFLDDMISISFGGKVIMPQRYLQISGADATGTFNIDGKFTYEATGYTGVIGLDVKPLKELTLSARYETETALEFKYKQDSLSGGGSGGVTNSLVTGTSVLNASGISDGKKFNYNLPAVLSLGVEYAVTPELSVMSSGNIYFLSQADMGYVGGTTTKLNSLMGTGWEAGLGASYKVMPALKLGLGVLYTDQGVKDAYFENKDAFLNCSANPPLNSWTYGLGATYTVIENLDLTLSGSWTHYIPKNYDVQSALMGMSATGTATVVLSTTDTHGTYKKEVYNISLGASYKI